MDVKKDIRLYRQSVDDVETSPFEAIDMLHLRDRLERIKDKLDELDRQQLMNYDMKLLLNAPQMYQHLRYVYDFSTAPPTDGWWWRLDEHAKINELLRWNGIV